MPESVWGDRYKVYTVTGDSNIASDFILVGNSDYSVARTLCIVEYWERSKNVCDLGVHDDLCDYSL
jgi:hypothetical protein